MWKEQGQNRESWKVESEGDATYFRSRLSCFGVAAVLLNTATRKLLYQHKALSCCYLLYQFDVARLSNPQYPTMFRSRPTVTVNNSCIFYFIFYPFNTRIHLKIFWLLSNSKIGPFIAALQTFKRWMFNGSIHSESPPRRKEPLISSTGSLLRPFCTTNANASGWSIIPYLKQNKLIPWAASFGLHVPFERNKLKSRQATWKPWGSLAC